MLHIDHFSCKLNPLLLLAAIGVLSGCSTAPAVPVAPASSASATTIQLALFPAWHDGRLVHYISTDTSDADMARAKNMNFAPRLAMALGDGVANPGRRSALERVYAFPGDSQPNVFPSAPTPIGAASTDAADSPLWHMYMVVWQPGRVPRELRSEEQVLAAAANGDVGVSATRSVANCPVVVDGNGSLLRGSRLGNPPAL